MVEKASKILYEHLPAVLQNAALNLYGVGNRRRLREWERHLAVLKGSETWSREEQITQVASSLRQVLEHAVAHVPRYRDRALSVPGHGAPPEAVFESLERFPIITRAEILEDPVAFLSQRFRPSDLVRTITSGTTGTPFSTWMEPGVKTVTDALWWRRTAWAGYRNGDWIARLVGDPVIPLRDRTPDPVYRRSHTDRRLYLSTYHLSDETAGAMFSALVRFQPEFVMGYPSALDVLSRMGMGRVDPGGWRPKAILFSSEPMFDHQRAAIEACFGAPIRGLYGCAERVLSAAECEEGSYHLSLVDGFLEGELGILTPAQPARITGLLNQAMPLIRYELGDDLTPSPESPCPCGRTLPQIDRVMTKHEDVVVTPSGRRISPSILTWAFKDLPGLERSQIVQVGAAELEVRVKVAEGAFPAVAAVLQPRIVELVFGEMTVRVIETGDLSVSVSGKSRFVVNEWSKGGAHGPEDSGWRHPQ